MSMRKLLDGGNPAVLTGEFRVRHQPAMIYGENLSTAIPLEVKTDTGWVPVLDAGAAVTLSATGDNPLGLFVNGEYRLIAASLAATEKVYFDQ